MSTFLQSRNFKIGVMFSVAGLVLADAAMWAAVALGVATIQLPLPLTALIVGLALVAFFVMITFGIGVMATRDVFGRETPSWVDMFMTLFTWAWVVLCIVFLSALYIGMLNYFFTVLWWV